tara:strand:- start:40392 stop:42119 length:1728 start_codon:yes stop_codon:yes gene_type:complete
MKRIEKYEIEFLYLFFTIFFLFIYKNLDLFLIFTLAILFFIVNRFNINLKIQSALYFVLATFVLNFQSFKAPLIYSHAFRQTQNAISSRYMADNNISVLNPLPHIGLSTNAPFEFPFLQILSSILQKFGVSEIFALRPLSWIIFIIFGLTVYFYVLSKTQNDKFGNYLLIVFTFHPLFYQYSNTFMIEFIPHIFGFAALKYFNDRNKKYSAIFLSLSLLSKITTGLVYFFLVFLVDYSKNSNKRLNFFLKRDQIFFYLTTVVPILIWLVVEEIVKNSSKFTIWLKGSTMRNWNFGTIDQYKDIDLYIIISKRVLENLGLLYPNYLIGLTIFLVLIYIERKLFVLFLVPFIFLNLYLVHDYYLLGIFPLVVYFIFSKIFDSFENYKIYLVLSFLILSNFNYLINTRFDQYQNLKLKQTEVSFENFDTGLIEILNKNEFQDLNNVYLKSTYYNWNPSVFFYSNKYGLMITDKMFNNEVNLEIEDFKNNQIDIFVFQKSDFNQFHFDLYRAHMVDRGFKFLKIEKFQFDSNLPELIGENLEIFIISPNEKEVGNFLIFDIDKTQFESKKTDLLNFINN